VLSELKGARVDSMLGDLAYPVFLIHWVSGLLVGHYLLHDLKLGERLFWMSLPVILVASFIVSEITRRCLDPLRSFVRNLANGG
jgi:peptidoglycan/LPS O-acetylase OafA/YrhL